MTPFGGACSLPRGSFRGRVHPGLGHSGLRDTGSASLGDDMDVPGSGGRRLPPLTPRCRFGSLLSLVAWGPWHGARGPTEDAATSFFTTSSLRHFLLFFF